MPDCELARIDPIGLQNVQIQSWMEAYPAGFQEPQARS
jgi:hypothetical protein